MNVRMDHNSSYQIERATLDQALPMHLLRLADESQSQIDDYLPSSQVYLLKSKNNVQGICLLRVSGQTGEIVNIAVEPACQGQGLGRTLLQYVKGVARQQSLRQLTIKTGNSSIGQLALYQQEGFDLVGVNYDYFIETYPQPIWENKIQCKHQLIFELRLG